MTLAGAGQLRWQCRRGMRELDVLLTRYLRRRHATASSVEQALFVQILGWQDPELVRYLLGGEVHADSATAKFLDVLRMP